MIAAGGTGGHVYPALAVAESLVKLQDNVDLFYVGTVGGFEHPLVQRASVHFVSHDEVQAGPIHGVNPIQMATSLFKLTVGTMQAFRLLRKHRPQVILSTGGWVSLPVTFVARLLGIPVLIFLPDIEPGLTIKVLRLFANKVATTTEASAKFFRAGQAIATGYPLRDDVLNANHDEAVAHFGLDPECKTLLVFGGSRGARAINIVIGDILSDLLDMGLQIIHVTGTLDYERTQQQIGDLSEHPHYHGVAYLHDDMGLAFAAADLAVCRAGASVLGEFPVFQLPSILIPLAYSWRYQQVNADYLAERGAAVHLDETNAPTQLLSSIREIIENPARMRSMRDNLQALARPDGADNVARLLMELAK